MDFYEIHPKGWRALRFLVTLSVAKGLAGWAQGCFAAAQHDKGSQYDGFPQGVVMLPFIDESTFPGDPRRATIKAHPSQPHHPRPYGC
jgi:hypothetical protein